MIISDIFGWTLKNTRLLADKESAELGVKVYVPDLYDWNPPEWLADKEIQPAETFLGRCGQWASLVSRAPEVIWWMITHGDKRTLSKLEAVFTELRRSGVSKIVCQGYCWGGRYSTLMGASDHVDGFIVAHPAFVKVPKDIEALKPEKPGLFILAEKDHTFSPGDVAKTLSIVTQQKKHVTVNEYPGTMHGFAVRGNMRDPVVMKARGEALQACVNFVRKVCKLPAPAAKSN